MGIFCTKEIDSGNAEVTYWRPEHAEDRGDGTMLFIMMGYIDKEGAGTHDNPMTRARHGRSFIMPLEGRTVGEVPRSEMYAWAKANVQPEGFFDGHTDDE